MHETDFAQAAHKKLKHDIKNIIAPAMLSVELLESHTDSQVQKAAGTINNSLERLLERLKQDPTI